MTTMLNDNNCCSGKLDVYHPYAALLTVVRIKNNLKITVHSCRLCCTMKSLQRRVGLNLTNKFEWWNFSKTILKITLSMQHLGHVCVWSVSCLHTSLYFWSVLASLVSQASTVVLLLWRVVSRCERSVGGNEDRLLNWANRAGDAQDNKNSSYSTWA